MKKLFGLFFMALLTLAMSAVVFAHDQRIYEAVMQPHFQRFSLDDVDVMVDIPRELSHMLSDYEINAIIQSNNLQGGELITIHHIGSLNVDGHLNFEPFNVTTTVRDVGSETTAQDFFVTSAARGQTIRLTSEWSRTLTVGITSSPAPISMTGQLGATVTRRYSVQHQFVGPPESSTFNTREFRVQFFAIGIHWTQSSFFNGFDDIRSGTGVRPTRYMSYSIDRRN